MIFNKDENIETQSPYVAALILKEFKRQKADKLSIFHISSALKKNKIGQYRQLVFGLTFLFATGIAEFKEPYLYIVNDKTD